MGKKRLEFKVTSDSCWEVTSHADRGRGYTTIFRNGKRYRTHRYIYEQLVGPIPNKKSVCHRCDNTSCINPDHLYIGSQSDNMKDARNKGRLWMQKLLPKDVWMIRWLRSKGERQKDVADLFQISHVTIYDIERERGWT